MSGEAYTPEGRNASGSTASEGLQTVTDQAKLSDVAPRIMALLSEMTGSENNVVDTLSANVEKLQEGFVDALYKTLSEKNFDLSQKMTLRLNSDNTLTVMGDHPEKEYMDAVLAENPALSAAFGEIASQSEVLRDIANINTVMMRQTGMSAYRVPSTARPTNAVYQMSLKGEMSHFYFTRA